MYRCMSKAQQLSRTSVRSSPMFQYKRTQSIILDILPPQGKTYFFVQYHVYCPIVRLNSSDSGRDSVTCLRNRSRWGCSICFLAPFFVHRTRRSAGSSQRLPEDDRLSAIVSQMSRSPCAVPSPGQCGSHGGSVYTCRCPGIFEGYMYMIKLTPVVGRGARLSSTQVPEHPKKPCTKGAGRPGRTNNLQPSCGCTSTVITFLPKKKALHMP